MWVALSFLFFWAQIVHRVTQDRADTRCTQGGYGLFCAQCQSKTSCFNAGHGVGLGKEAPPLPRLSNRYTFFKVALTDSSSTSAGNDQTPVRFQLSFERT